MMTVEYWHCLKQGSLRLLISGIVSLGQRSMHWSYSDMS